MSSPSSSTPNLDQLKRQAKELLQAFQAGEGRARERLGSVLPKLGGVSADRTVGFQARLADAQLVVARENGFDSWPQLKACVESGQGGPTPFLRAALAIVNGDTESLGALLAADPELIRQRSSEAHRAQLLHYVAANGVENHLQRTPANAVEICRLLLAAGAEADSACETYGGGPNQTPMNLLVSSVHPHRAGLQAALVECLIDGGAAVDGPLQDGAPLRTALAFGYTATAETLRRRGARADALDLAAGLGDSGALAALWDRAVDDVEVASSTDDDWRPVASGRFHAFLLACRNGQVDAARALLDLRIDINACPADGGTGLHEAILWDHPGVARALLERGADAAVRHRRFGATALDFAAYNGRLECLEILLDAGAEDLDEALVSAAGQGHVAIARRLLAAGADAEGARRRAAEVGNEAMRALLGT